LGHPFSLFFPASLSFSFPPLYPFLSRLFSLFFPFRFFLFPLPSFLAELPWRGFNFKVSRMAIFCGKRNPRFYLNIAFFNGFLRICFTAS
jgi:hypothetical protein